MNVLELDGVTKDYGEVAALRGVSFSVRRGELVAIVADGLLYAGVRAVERYRLADEALDRVGLSDRATFRPTRISGGQRQRVAIARALVGSPSIVLADEPTGNLDSTTGASIMALLHELNAGGSTIIMITHDSGLADQLPRRIRVLDGRVVSDTGAAR